MDEVVAQEHLQVWIRALAGFETASVTINDYSVFDKSLKGGPYVVIENSNTFSSIRRGYTPEDTWKIPVLLIVPFTTDQPTLNSFRDYRQTIINTANNDGNRAPIAGADINTIYSGSDIIDFYSEGVRKGETGTYPLYIFQQIIFNVETF